MSQVVWRRDFIKFPASRSQGCWQGRAGLTTLSGVGGVGGRYGQCLALTVFTEMWLGARGPFGVWWLMMDGKRGGAQKLCC